MRGNAPLQVATLLVLWRPWTWTGPASDHLDSRFVVESEAIFVLRKKQAMSKTIRGSAPRGVDANDCCKPVGCSLPGQLGRDAGRREIPDPAAEGS